MSVPDVNINPDTSSKKMWIVGGFLFIVVAVPVVYFLLSKSPSPKSNACMIDQDCEKGYVCLNKMCIAQAPRVVPSDSCKNSEDCPVNMECKNQKCVAKPPPTPPTPPVPPTSCSSNAECKVAGTICVDKKCVVPECTTTDDCCLNSDDCSGYFMCSNNKCVCKNGNDMPFCKWRYINFKNQIYDENKKLFSKNARPATYGLQNIYGCLDRCNTDPDCGGVQILQTSSDEIMSATDKVAETNKLATSDGYCYIVGTDPSKALAQSVNAADNNPWVLYYKKQYWPVPD